MNRRATGRVRLAAWAVLVGAVTLGLTLAGRGPLAAPPLAHPGAWADWLTARDPVVAAVAVVRLAALAASWYLVAASALGVVLRVCRLRRLVVLADRATLPALRHLLVATAGLTLVSASPAWAAARAGPTGLSGPRAAAAPAQSASSTTTVVEATAGAASASSGPLPTLTMHLVGPGDAAHGRDVGATSTTAAPTTGVPTTGAPGVPATLPAPTAVLPQHESADVGATWTVRPGECFWSIAADVLAQAWGRAPTDAEIVPYWRGLIEENRGRLADRANPSLIFPGQVFTVPTPSRL